MVGRLIRLRGWWGGIVLAAMAAAIFFKLPATFCAVQIGHLQLICPVGFIEISLATKSIIFNMLPGVLLVIGLSVITGRSFCSWVCPARYAGKKIKNIGYKKTPRLATWIIDHWNRMKSCVQRHFTLTVGDGLAMLTGLMIGIWFFEFPAYSLFCPVGVLSRNLIELVLHQHLRFDLLFLTIPLVLGLMFKTGWKCACPMGLVRGIAAKPNMTLQPIINYNICIRCGRCMQNCAFGVNLHSKTFDSFSCSKCLNCFKDCKKGAIELKIFNV